jgi:RNA polymerase subunit RPABC4/transcription elongation factor Spt4
LSFREALTNPETMPGSQAGPETIRRAEALADAAIAAHKAALERTLTSPSDAARHALEEARETMAKAIASFAAVRRVVAIGHYDADGDLITVEHKKPTWGGQRAPTFFPKAGAPQKKAATTPAPQLCPACGKAEAGPMGGRCQQCVGAHRRTSPERSQMFSKKRGKPCRRCGKILTPYGGMCRECHLVHLREYNRNFRNAYLKNQKAVAS